MNENGKQPPRFAAVFIVAAAMALMAVGCLAITVCQMAEGSSGYALRQLIYCMIGLAAMAAFSLLPYQRIGRYAYILYGVTLLLLVLVFFLPAVRGSHRWINLGLVKLQPSEIAKLSLVILLAWYLRLGDHYRKLIGLLPPFVMTLVPMGLILLEPDLGTALLFLPTLYIMLFMAGAKLVHLLGIIVVATVLVAIPVTRSERGMSRPETAVRESLSYWTYAEGDETHVVSPAILAFMEYHQLQRIDGWLRQGDSDIIRGKGYHLYHSKTVLGSGKFLGRGGWETAELYFRSLPDDHTDFIFSIIGGQWGFACCMLVLVLYGVIVVLGVEIAATTHEPFGRLLAIGLIGFLICQVFINVGMTIGLLPITGMTLPFVSYGGSSLVVNCAAVGLLINIGHNRPILYSRRPFEHKEDTRPVPSHPLEQKNGAPGGAAAKRGGEA